MLGALLLNSTQQVCFVDLDRTDEIAAFRYIADVRLLVVILTDGNEQLFTSEIAPELHDALQRVTELLVVQLDELDPKRATSERMAPLMVVA